MAPCSQKIQKHWRLCTD